MDYQLIDADGHYYEPDDRFSRHIEAHYKDATVRVEDWGYGADGRIFGVPMLSLVDLDEALAELHRVLNAGARLVHLRPGPVGGRSPAHPDLDPFWATVAEAGVGVVFHVSNSGYNQFYGSLWSEDPTNPSHLQSPLQWALCNTERPIVDTLTALTLHNLFGRHPDVRVISIENGSDWLKPLLKSVDKAAALGRCGPMLGGPLPPRPSEVLAQHNTAGLLGLPDGQPVEQTTT